jgi:hypothetical protein
MRPARKTNRRLAGPATFVIEFPDAGVQACSFLSADTGGLCGHTDAWKT